MEPFVSVIIPVYNREKYIEETVNSVLSQPYKKMEIILINDGSTDESEVICKNLAKKYKHIKYYYKRNTGVSDTRNFGIKVSMGEYLIFLDADDTWCNDVIRLSLIEDISTRLYDIVAFGMNYCYEDISKIQATILPEKSACEGKDKAVDGLYVSFCSMMFKKTFILENGLWFDPNIRYIEDSLFRTKAQYLAKSIYISEKVLLNYRNNPTSVMHTSNQKDFVMDYYKVYQELYLFFEEHYQLENRSFFVNSNLGQRCLKSAYYLCEFVNDYDEWYNIFFKNDVIMLFYDELKKKEVSAPAETIKHAENINSNPKKFYYKNRIKLCIIEVRRFIYRAVVGVLKG